MVSRLPEKDPPPSKKNHPKPPHRRSPPLEAGAPGLGAAERRRRRHRRSGHGAGGRPCHRAVAVGLLGGALGVAGGGLVGEGETGIRWGWEEIPRGFLMCENAREGFLSLPFFGKHSMSV